MAYGRRAGLPKLACPSSVVQGRKGFPPVSPGPEGDSKGETTRLRPWEKPYLKPLTDSLHVAKVIASYGKRVKSFGDSNTARPTVAKIGFSSDLLRRFLASASSPSRDSKNASITLITLSQPI